MKKRKLTSVPVDKQISRIANQRFGIEEFRLGQEELIRAALSGRDSLGIMPTGSGKSLCFQLPSLLLDKSVLVVSPLISLMQDQHHKLIDLGIPAAKINSTVSAGEQQEIKAAVAEGERELIYVTPERLENSEFLSALQKGGVSLVVIDEAHCISQWGHDFRPAYTALSIAIKSLGRPPIMALTATATSDVTDDIISQLELKDPLTVRRSIDRRNLTFHVCNTMNESIKHEKMLELIRLSKGACIIYVATVKAANEVADFLSENEVKCAAYHGKLSGKVRQQIQQDFMSDQYQAIVATKAFGMGIDKENVRLVVHYQFPDSVESYYQEAGRAGRDGEEAQAVLLYQLEDKRIQSYFLGGKYPSRQDASLFLQSLKKAGEEGNSLNLKDLAATTGTALNKLRVIANYLAGAGLVKKSKTIKIMREFDSDDALAQFLKEYEERHQSDRDRLEQIMHYAQTMQCRVTFLRQYFGEDPKHTCGRCDNCLATPLAG